MMEFDPNKAREQLRLIDGGRSDHSRRSQPQKSTPLYATLEELKAARLTPSCIVEDYLYADVSLLIAQGGSGKTTLMLYEAIHIALGLPLWGRTVMQSGRTLIISAEDSREILLARLYQLILALELNDQQIAIVLEQIMIKDVCGEPYKLVSLEQMIMPTNLGDRIVERFQDANLRMVVFDPIVSFGASEQAVNDNEQALIIAARRIVRGLNCCVRYVHHVSQAVARGKISDQYAGRGGTAMADGARMVTVLTRCDEADTKNAPPGCDLRSGDSLLTMTQAKLSYAPPIPKQWIRRRDFAFDYFREPPKQSAQDRVASQMAQLERFLIEQVKAEVYLNQSSIENGYLGELNLTRTECRACIARLTSSHRLVDVELPASHKKGRRTTFLCPEALSPKFVDVSAELAE